MTSLTVQETPYSVPYDKEVLSNFHVIFGMNKWQDIKQ